MVKGTSGIDQWFANRTEKEKNRRKGGWVLFLAVSDEVAAALDAGYNVKVIHEYLTDQGKLKCSYDTFRGYVKKYQQKPIRAVAASAPAIKEQAPGQKGNKATAPKPQATKLKQFEFNPEPNKSELI
jgi:hypothetical protein